MPKPVKCLRRLTGLGFALRGSNKLTIPKPSTGASNLLNDASIQQVALAFLGRPRGTQRQGGSNEKARSSERACKKQNRHGFPCLQHVTWRRRGDSESRCARFTSSAKASSRFAENSPPGCFPGANRPHRFESPCCCHKTKQARFPVPVAYNLAEEGGFEPP